MTTSNTDEPGADGKDRVAKVMARAGLCSRRDAEAWIKAGRVAINGTVITSPALNIGPEDRIAVDGQSVEARERTRLFLYHKPRGLVTTAKDPEGRPTVFDNLPEGLPRLISVGRLDINTEGLLLLTNDGGLARILELPATGWLRRYRVRANGRVSPEQLAGLKDGITIEGVHYAGIEADLDRVQGANLWLTMGLREGKNREIKRVLEHLGLAVNRLIRLSFGPFQLGDIVEGEVEEVRARVLKDQLGPALAAEAGVAWEDAVQAPVVTAQAQRAPAPEKSRHEGGRRDGAARAGRDAAPEPRRERPKPAARPHVSALRAERAAADDEPRKRTTRSKTADRKGRTVAVERITVEGKARHTGEGGSTRNARNFARVRREAADAEHPEKARSRRTPRPERGVAAAAAEAPRSRGRTFGSDRPATGRALKDAKTRGARPPGGGSDRPSGGAARPRAGTDRPQAGGPARPRTGGDRPRPGGPKRPGPRSGR